MNRWLVGLTALLLLAGVALADLKITGKTKVERDRIVRLSAEGAPADAALIWDVSDEDRADIEEVGGRLLFSAPPGVYKIKVRSVRLKDAKTLIETARTVVTIGDPEPPPVPPVPPGPTPVPPGPVPPGPTPGPAPIPLNGLRVMIIFESAEGPKLPPAQQGILYGKTMREYLDKVCVIGADGKTREWWIVDKDADMSATAKHWQEVMKRPRSTVPWVIISNGKAGFEGPLPATVSEMMELVKRYASTSRKGGK